MGVTGTLSSVDPTMLEAFVRDELNLNAKRVMAVLDPIKVKILNLPTEKKGIRIDVPDFPNQPERGLHQIVFDEIVYIESTDFRENNTEKSYRRLTKGIILFLIILILFIYFFFALILINFINYSLFTFDPSKKDQSVGLRYANYVIEIVDIIKDGDKLVELHVNATPIEKVDKKPKAFIHWVSRPLECEVRLYESLFKHKNPEDKEQVPDGFVSDCNLDSLKVINNALIEDSILNSKIYDKFQFERVGFFSIDPDTKDKRFVFNRTVLLNEDKSKNA